MSGCDCPSHMHCLVSACIIGQNRCSSRSIGDRLHDTDACMIPTHLDVLFMRRTFALLWSGLRPGQRVHCNGARQTVNHTSASHGVAHDSSIRTPVPPLASLQARSHSSRSVDSNASSKRLLTFSLSGHNNGDAHAALSRHAALTSWHLPMVCGLDGMHDSRLTLEW